ncbi:hypothetical protein [Klebsiella pneumoniae]|uniref:hypothetical protein n=1 Tax=Klebsiella pneumoniae TaxID=573 RepID=UPI001F4BB0BE|nr:hypothetical protein [Klebsiella pneumoniae]
MSESLVAHNRSLSLIGHPRVDPIVLWVAWTQVEVMQSMHNDAYLSGGLQRGV